jgi:hypothetical protein
MSHPPPFLKVQRVSIGGWSIVVEYDPELEEFGQWLFDEKIIRIGPKAEKCFYETLRHEMKHASLSIGGVAYNEGMEEEAIVRCLDNLFWPAWEQLIIP